jgi:putative spermidine/putrescine transport system ATP-binding protein
MISGDVVVVLGTSLPVLGPSGGGPAVTALVRPQAVSITPGPDGKATVLTSSLLGPTSRVTVIVDDGPVFAQVAGGSLPSLTAGTRVRVAVQPIPVALLAG